MAVDAFKVYVAHLRDEAALCRFVGFVVEVDSQDSLTALSDFKVSDIDVFDKTASELAGVKKQLKDKKIIIF